MRLFRSLLGSTCFSGHRDSTSQITLWQTTSHQSGAGAEAGLMSTYRWRAEQTHAPHAYNLAQKRENQINTLLFIKRNTVSPRGIWHGQAGLAGRTARAASPSRQPEQAGRKQSGSTRRAGWRRWAGRAGSGVSRRARATMRRAL